MAHQREQIINKQKMFFWPILLVTLAMLLTTGTGYYVNRRLFLNQMEREGYNFVKILSGKLLAQHEHLEFVNRQIEERIRQAADKTIAYREYLSTDILADIADLAGIDQIYWYSPEGEVLYSATDEYVGWRPTPGDPIDRFMLSGEEEFYEPVRKSTETDDYYQFFYKRTADGYFVQAGLNADAIKSLVERYELQSIVNESSREENIHYVLFVNPDLVAIADSDLEDIGTHYLDDAEYIAALSGKQSAVIWHYDKIDGDVLEVVIPVVYHGEIIGALAVGLSMDHINQSLFWSTVTFAGILAFFLLVYFCVQKRNLLDPMGRLDKAIRSINVNTGSLQELEYSCHDPLAGLYRSVNALLANVDLYIHAVHRMKEKIEEDAITDPLTGVANRRVFVSDLEKSLRDGQAGAVLMLDLDDFKDINDASGHVYGDQVLKSVAEVLEQFANDKVSIYRFGGDEFLVLYQNMVEESEVLQFIQSLMHRFHGPIAVGASEEKVTFSIGVALYPKDAQTVDDLIKYADMAMYSVDAKNTYVLFTRTMLDKLEEKKHAENVLRSALYTEGFEVYYQAKVCARKQIVIGYEALLRLKHSDMSPAKFIPIAEESGLIIELGRWVAREVVYQIKRWRETQGIDVPVSMNLSVKQLKDQGFVGYLRQIINEAKIDPRYLEVEITENHLIEQEETTIAFLKDLREVGVQLSLDDFGSGFSSLNYLAFLPVSTIKLDKSICDNYRQPKSSALIKGILAMCRNMGLEVVAEGIDSLEQYQYFVRIGCNYVQGYLFSVPLPVDEATKLIAKRIYPKESTQWHQQTPS